MDCHEIKKCFPHPYIFSRLQLEAQAFFRPKQFIYFSLLSPFLLLVPLLWFPFRNSLPVKGMFCCSIVPTAVLRQILLRMNYVLIVVFLVSRAIAFARCLLKKNLHCFWAWLHCRFLTCTESRLFMYGGTGARWRWSVQSESFIVLVVIACCFLLLSRCCIWYGCGGCCTRRSKSRLDLLPSIYGQFYVRRFILFFDDYFLSARLFVVLGWMINEQIKHVATFCQVCSHC